MDSLPGSTLKVLKDTVKVYISTVATYLEEETLIMFGRKNIENVQWGYQYFENLMLVQV